MSLSRYHVKRALRETWWTIKHPRRTDLFEFAYAWWAVWDDLVQPFRSCWYGLENLWHYRCVIWNDRDWDHNFILTLWEKKFRRMAAHFRRYGHHVNSEADARQLQVCAELCHRIWEDNYERLASIHFEHEHVHNERDEKQQSEEFMRIQNAARKQKQEDLNYLCTLVKKNLFKWWD